MIVSVLSNLDYNSTSKLHYKSKLKFPKALMFWTNNNINEQNISSQVRASFQEKEKDYCTMMATSDHLKKNIAKTT